MTRLALAAIALLLCAGCETRTIMLTYQKANAPDLQVKEDKQILAKTKGVKNVVLDHERDGTAKLSLMVEAGKEMECAVRAEELGYKAVK